jgi:hypothetical protein
MHAMLWAFSLNSAVAACFKSGLFKTLLKLKNPDRSDAGLAKEADKVVVENFMIFNVSQVQGRIAT